MKTEEQRDRKRRARMRRKIGKGIKMPIRQRYVL
jgi:hypothetical protein